MLYMLPAVVTYRYEIGKSIYLFVILIIIFFVNKFFLRLYRILPFVIEVDEQKITFSQFIRKDKKIILHFSEIEKLEGGIFYGKSKGLMQIEGGKTTIGFFHHLTNANIFITTLLQNVPLEVYKKVEIKIHSRLEV